MLIEMKKELTQLTTKLMQHESVEGHADLAMCAQWIESYLKKNTPKTVRIQRTTYKSVPSVVAVQGAWKNPDILLSGHFDVVPGKRDDFVPRIHGDKIYGRGAADMKAGVASLMHGFITTVNERPDLSIGIMLTGDEESAGQHGTGHLAELGWKTGEVICFDGGYGESISHAEKGLLRLRFTSEGTTGRVHHRWEGRCALEGIVDAYDALRELFPCYNKATEEDNWHTTFTPKKVVTSPNENAVVDRAEMAVSIHYTETTTPEKLTATIQKKVPHVKVTLEAAAPRVYVDPKSVEVQTFRKIYKKHLGRQPSIGTENGTSDARYFSHLNIPMIITKPKSGNPEQDGEWVSINSTVKLTKTLIDYLRSK